MLSPHHWLPGSLISPGVNGRGVLVMQMPRKHLHSNSSHGSAGISFGSPSHSCPSHSQQCPAWGTTWLLHLFTRPRVQIIPWAQIWAHPHQKSLCVAVKKCITLKNSVLALRKESQQRHGQRNILRKQMQVEAGDLTIPSLQWWNCLSEIQISKGKRSISEVPKGCKVRQQRDLIVGYRQIPSKIRDSDVKCSISKMQARGSCSVWASTCSGDTGQVQVELRHL